MATKNKIEKLEMCVRIHFETEGQARVYKISKELKKDYTFNSEVQKSSEKGYYLVGTVRPKR